MTQPNQTYATAQELERRVDEIAFVLQPWTRCRMQQDPEDPKAELRFTCTEGYDPDQWDEGALCDVCRLIVSLARLQPGDE